MRNRGQIGWQEMRLLGPTVAREVSLSPMIGAFLFCLGTGSRCLGGTGIALRKPFTDNFMKPGKASLGSYVPATLQEGRKELAFSFSRASLTGLAFGVGKGGPETFSPDMMGLRARLVPDRWSWVLISSREAVGRRMGVDSIISRQVRGSLVKLRSQSLALPKLSQDMRRLGTQLKKKFSMYSRSTPDTAEWRKSPLELAATSLTQESEAQWWYLPPRKSYSKLNRATRTALLSSRLPRAS